MLLRAAGLLACLAYAGLAFGSGMDRLAATDPVMAARVPAPFASQALRTLGAQAIGQGQAGEVLRLGQAALKDSPTDPQSAALLGAGLLATGNRAAADRAFRVAGQLGWRVPITQNYWMSKALAQGDYTIAALRLDALLRQQPALHRERALLDPMERNPAGRAALIGRMAARPDWVASYTGDVADLPADVMLQRSALLLEAAPAGLILGCPAIAPSASRLAALGRFGEGSALWRAHCPAAGTALVADGNLAMANLGQPASAYAWEVIGNSELSLGFIPSPGGSGQRVTLDGTAAHSRVFLTQLLTLAPGRYGLSWSAGNAQLQPSSQVLSSLTCRGQQPSWLTAELDQRSGRWLAVVTVPADCPAQTLSFGAAAGSLGVWLEQIRIVPAR